MFMSALWQPTLSGTPLHMGVVVVVVTVFEVVIVEVTVEEIVETLVVVNVWLVLVDVPVV